MSIKFRLQVTGRNQQGVAVVKHQRIYTADLKCSEEAEREVMEMVARHIEALAKDLEQAAAEAVVEIALRSWRPLGPTP